MKKQLAELVREAKEKHIYSEEIAQYLIERGVVIEKHGVWLLNGRCSNCLENPLTTHRTYCPNCGAKMDGERKQG